MTTKYLTIVFAILAVGRHIGEQTRWPIRKLVCTARRYRPIDFQTWTHIIMGAVPHQANPPPRSCAPN